MALPDEAREFGGSSVLLWLVVQLFSVTGVAIAVRPLWSTDLRELSYMVGIVAALFLGAAAVAWFKIRRNPKDDLTAGQGGKPDSNRLKTASLLIATALGIGGIAAAIAIVSWVLRVLKIS